MNNNLMLIQYYLKNFKVYNKTVLLLITVLFILTQKSAAIAFDDWESVYADHNKAEYEKIISNQEYENAIQTMEKYNKSNKKSKKDSTKKENKTKVILDMPAKNDPLFLLPINANCNGQLIQHGFYLASGISKNNKYFIRLTHGEGRIIADIEAKVLNHKIDSIAKIRYRPSINHPWRQYKAIWNRLSVGC